MKLRLWTLTLALAQRLRWPWLIDRARAYRFRAELARQKLDVAKVRAESGMSDDADASREEGVVPIKAKRKRAKRSAKSA